MDLTATTAAIDKITRCQELTRQHALSDKVTALDQMLTMLRHVEQLHRRTEEE